MRIGVLGTCQAQSYASCVRALMPDAQVRHFFLNLCDPPEVTAFAADCDLFLVQPIQDDVWGELATPRLPQQNLGLLPHVLFTGFQPDITVVAEWGAAHSLIGGYHSALIAACYHLGLPAARVPALFNAYVYQELGYLNEYDRARAFLIEDCAAIGFDVADRIDEWERAGTSFMHTINHPSVRVLFDLVRTSLIRAGLIGTDATAELPEDVLAGVTWPVFECVAERHGIATDPMFRVLAQATPLTEFVDRSYVAYADADRTVLAQTPGIAKAIATLERIGLR